VGEWADDTAMALPMLQALAAGKDLRAKSTQDEVVAQWVQWVKAAKDVAPVITTTLSSYDPALGAESLRAAAAAAHTNKPSAQPGNASLMRSTPITLGYLHDPDGLADTVRTYSDLTHGNPVAGDACVLLNLAQRHAILTGELDLAGGLPWIPEGRQDWWERHITQAEIGLPEDFALHNGWAVPMLQMVWSAISHSDGGGPEDFDETLRTVIGAGGDTATGGAVAGGLLGARSGVSAIPPKCRRRLHGWPGLDDHDLMRLVWQALEGRSWPGTFDVDAIGAPAVPHPADPGVWLGGVANLQPLPPQVDAVVSLCRLGWDQMPIPMPAAGDHVCIWLMESEEPDENRHLELVAEQAVDVLAQLRDEGRTVYLHCDDGTSRTPFIAALYGTRVGRASAQEVLREIENVMPHAKLNPRFEHLIQRRRD
jgi:ADP-ribosylglycohydrolase